MVYKGANKPLLQELERRCGWWKVRSNEQGADKVRINAELIDASSDRLIWAKS